MGWLRARDILDTVKSPDLISRAPKRRRRLKNEIAGWLSVASSPRVRLLHWLVFTSTRSLGLILSVTGLGIGLSIPLRWGQLP